MYFAGKCIATFHTQISPVLTCNCSCNPYEELFKSTDNKGYFKVIHMIYIYHIHLLTNHNHDTSMLKHKQKHKAKQKLKNMAINSKERSELWHNTCCFVQITWVYIDSCIFLHPNGYSALDVGFLFCSVF